MAKIIKDFQVEVSKQEILRLLGHTSKPEEIKERSKKLVEEMISFSCDLIKPEGIFVIRESRELPEECFFDSEKVAFCICTIGKSLEKQVERLTNQGELARVVTLDAIGSVAAESTAEHLNQVIADEAKKKKLYGNTRFSPGYGGWKLEAQRFIFDILPAEKIGVRLNRSFMMIPRKSVSFAVNLSRNRFKDENSDPCQICGLKECRFRKDA
ncbi:MAG: vitamin B12 dependent-methionine synthase activation domain-containing protein [candidate division Zixibacteria bacterium]|nr:vitamin B12 dependent-methionine synthase activation domain-containing protein [candidate division Zixibacteria bacterium]